MKASKFIKDLFITGVTQIIVLLLSMILLKIMATALSKEYFGIFMIIRRILAVGAPLITLNLGVGLARYVSYEREKEKEFLNVSLFIVSFFSLLTFIIFLLLKNPLSYLFFGTSEYGSFLVLTGLFLLSYGIFSVSYAFFRGRQDMNRANRMQILYYAFPPILALVLWITFKHYKMLILYFFFFSMWGIALGIGNIRHNLSLHLWLKIKETLNSIRHLFVYSFSRIPSGFFLALTFGAPVFVASRKISLVAAAYVGIAVAIVRLTEVLAIPFNLLFLPKFAEIKRKDNPQEISQKASIVIDFIITALPLFAVIVYGLSNYIVIVFFENKYAPAIPGVSIVILFSTFYVAYVLIRGILDGLMSFPYVNIICFSGFLTTALFSFLWNQTPFILAIDFGIGLLIMGITAFYILLKRGKVFFQINRLFNSLLLMVFVFVILFFLDKWIKTLSLNEYLKFGIVILYRSVFFWGIFLLYWKPKTLWTKELLYRVSSR